MKNTSLTYNYVECKNTPALIIIEFCSNLSRNDVKYQGNLGQMQYDKH